MKLTKTQAEKISKEYGLGKVKGVKLIEDGWINYNFDLKTSSGRYIIRILNYPLNEIKKRQRKAEFKLLRYLNKINFNYKVPIPLKNKKGNYLSRVNKRNLWVYKRINGTQINKVADSHIREIAKAIALYHLSIKNLKTNLEQDNFNDLILAVKKFKEIKRLMPKNKIDKLMKENFDYFEGLLIKLIKINFKSTNLLAHSDLDRSNVLFEKGKIVAFLDFDNLKYGSKLYDLQNTIKSFCHVGYKIDKRKYSLFLKEYQEYNKLSKKEIQMIPLFILKECIDDFWWIYNGMNKEIKNKYFYFRWNIIFTKNLVKDFYLDRVLRQFT